MTALGQRAALYLRLSREDDEHEAGSESIRNQRELLLRYATANGFTVCGEYVDDGWSGTRFDRPAFLRLLRDIEHGAVDAVLTKDLSRLGRDYIMTGHYVERYFPEHGVRYIAVNDGVDTAARGASNDMTPFKAVLNDLYARDISQKVRSALETKRACGKFMGARAPYGYRRDMTDKNHLVPDTEQAEAVRRLFALFLGGESLRGTARRLDALGVPPPGAARGAVHWNDATVRRILKNPVYIGDLEQGKTRKLSYKTQKREPVPRTAWAVEHGTHEAIVSRTQFEEAQALLLRRARPTGGPHRVYPLAGLVLCGACGSQMTPLRQGTRTYLVCGGWKRGGACASSQCIRADAVLNAVREELGRRLGLMEAAGLCAAAGHRHSAAERVEQRWQEAERALVSLYRDKARGIFPEEEYLRLAQALRREAESLREEAKRVRQRECGAAEALVTSAKCLLDAQQLAQGELAVLVKRVVVGESKAITIHFAFCEPPLCVDKVSGA